MELISNIVSFNGQQRRYAHQSESLSCPMNVSVYLPPDTDGPVPVLYWLSGLTCNDENFVQKAGAQQHAARLGMAIVAADTSPRGDNIPDDPDASWDFGLGAGFYVNATRQPWDQHYHMYDYITAELPTLLEGALPLDPERRSLSGHSMGGHGALSIALRNPERYRSVSAFSPIVAPSEVPWGIKAFSNYLGDDRKQWLAHDSCALLRSGAQPPPMRVDQGTADTFLEEQLQTHKLQQACSEAGVDADIRMQEGYDHSYFFIASLIGEHMDFHAQACAD